MNPIYKFELNRQTSNSLNPKAVVAGLLNTNNGVLDSSNTSYQTTDFISIEPGTNYKLCDKDTFTAWSASAACFYTANKTFISGSFGIGATPANAAYLRVSYPRLNENYGVFPSNVSNWSDYVNPQAFPIYKDDLAKDFELQQNQEFFRAKLSGKLTFVGPDYEWIVGRAFDFQFLLRVFISYDAGQDWTEYWRGTFWKTDCEFDGDAKTVQVTPTVQDRYNDILAGLEKEYNLIELAPEIIPVKADKRPMIQIYVPGQSVVGCFLSGMWWEQECEPVTNENDLVNKYYFSLNKSLRSVRVSGSMSPQLPDIFAGTPYQPTTQGTTEYTNGNYKFQYFFYQSSTGRNVRWSIIRISDNVTLWTYQTAQIPPSIPNTVTLNPVSGSGASGTVTLDISDLSVYARYVCDALTINTIQTYEIPADDLVENNRNYRRVVGYYGPDSIYFSQRFSSTPTPWGLYQPGQYYQEPAGSWYYGQFYPVARNGWGRISVWFAFYAFDWINEEAARAPFTLRDAFPLSSVISVLLGQIAPGITHDATTDYSEFLYGANPITGQTQTLLITPKSNVVSAGYDQPAQRAPITLKSVTDMLRDCFRCYWFIDEQNRFRIEHITYFMRGGTYSGTPVVGIDLTAAKVTRNNKEWAFARNQYQFDKPNMAARYQFGWMDDVTQLFYGYPIDIISKYVNPENIEQINVSQFTSDVDYILLNPGAISKDGFVLLSAIYESGEYRLPYLNFNYDNANHILQNAYVAFVYLQQYYAFDMPAYEYEINGVQMYAYGIKKLKTQQLRFPALTDPDLLRLIKTDLGNGMIQKLSVNLSSRNANVTLKYDTE